MKNYLIKLASGETLSEDETYDIFSNLLGFSDAALSDSQVGAYLFSTSTREITSDELVGGARSLREHVSGIDREKHFKEVDFVDTCGTGGSGLDGFNTSTLVAFVLAASGKKTAKHGNRAATSKCGSADLLEALGVKIDLSLDRIINCIKETNFGFFFAPMHHPATKRVVGIRKELKIRTIFNFLGPLTNPAGASIQLLGVSHENMLESMAKALQKLKTKRAMVVRGLDGLDEITLTGVTKVVELNNSELSSYELNPTDYGFELADASEIKGSTPEISKEYALSILNGEKSRRRDLVLLNAGAALYLSGETENIKEGIEVASSLIDSGKAMKALESIISVTNS